MKRFSLILLFAILFHSAGCEAVTDRMSRSLDRAADDYSRVTNGGNSKYIADQRSQP